jgi:hypothetical protein
VHLVDGAPVDQRSDVDAILGAPPHRQRPHALRQGLGERLRDRAVDEEAVGGHARLADVAHLGGHGAVDRRVEVRVLEDQEGRVAAQLHGHAQDPLGGLGHQRAAHLRGPRERQLAGPLVGEQRAHHLAGGRGGDHVEHAVGQPALAGDLGQPQGGQGCQGGGLDHRGAAGGERRTDLAGRHRQREVPRGDQQAGPHGAAGGQDAPVAAGRGQVAPVRAHRLLGVPPQELGAVGDLALRLLQRLAHLERDEQRQLVGALDHRVEDPAQQLGALAGRGALPAGLRLVRRRQRGVAVTGIGIGHAGQHLVGGRVQHVELAATRCLGPGTTDQQPGGCALE